MSDALRIFVLAGEPSGDRIAADLVRRLKARTSIELTGVGGDELQAEGLSSIYPMSDLTVMGITDVLRRLPLLLWRVEQTARAVCARRPHLVVLVDAQDFSKLVAKRLKSLNYDGPLVLYVAPSVWARAPGRAAKLHPLFDEVLAVLPFEPEVMQRLGGPSTAYVGHPALAERLVDRPDIERGPLLLMAGSREGELRRHLPMFRTVVEQIGSHPCIDGIVMPTLRSLQKRLEDEVANWPVPVTVFADRQARPMLYQRSVAALSVAGTATLELALAQVPTVVTYVMDAHQARGFEKLDRPRISLPNIILGRTAVPELVQSKGDAAAMAGAVLDLLDNKKARLGQIAAFGELAVLMERGTDQFPRQDPADRVLAHWRRDQRALSGS